MTAAEAREQNCNLFWIDEMGLHMVVVQGVTPGSKKLQSRCTLKCDNPDAPTIFLLRSDIGAPHYENLMQMGRESLTFNVDDAKIFSSEQRGLR